MYVRVSFYENMTCLKQTSKQKVERGCRGSPQHSSAEECANSGSDLLDLLRMQTRGSAKPLFVLQIQGKTVASGYLKMLRKPPKVHLCCVGLGSLGSKLLPAILPGREVGHLSLPEALSAPARGQGSGQHSTRLTEPGQTGPVRTTGDPHTCLSGACARSPLTGRFFLLIIWTDYSHSVGLYSVTSSESPHPALRPMIRHTIFMAFITVSIAYLFAYMAAVSAPNWATVSSKGKVFLGHLTRAYSTPLCLEGRFFKIYAFSFHTE